MAIYERNRLAKQMGCSTSTLRTYLCRSEFCHVHFKKIKGRMYYIKLTLADLYKLQNFIKRRSKKIPIK